MARATGGEGGGQELIGGTPPASRHPPSRGRRRPLEILRTKELLLLPTQTRLRSPLQHVGK